MPSPEHFTPGSFTEMAARRACRDCVDAVTAHLTPELEFGMLAKEPFSRVLLQLNSGVANDLCLTAGRPLRDHPELVRIDANWGRQLPAKWPARCRKWGGPWKLTAHASELPGLVETIADLLLGRTTLFRNYAWTFMAADYQPGSERRRFHHLGFIQALPERRDPVEQLWEQVERSIELEEQLVAAGRFQEGAEEMARRIDLLDEIVSHIPPPGFAESCRAALYAPEPTPDPDGELQSESSGEEPRPEHSGGRPLYQNYPLPSGRQLYQDHCSPEESDSPAQGNEDPGPEAA